SSGWTRRPSAGVGNRALRGPRRPRPPSCPPGGDGQGPDGEGGQAQRCRRGHDRTNARAGRLRGATLTLRMSRGSAMRLKNKGAIITGGGGGMGRVAAQMFATEGARVVVAEYSEAAGAETVDMVRAAGGEATFVKT